VKINKLAVFIIFIFILPFFPDEISGQTYFQQRVNYRIRVSLNDISHELSAFEEIEYFNNSPDTLKKLYFHLWPNAYLNNKTALAKQLLSVKGKQKLFKDPFLRGYIDSLDFKINGTPVEWHLTNEYVDICEIFPDEPIPPGGSVQITTPFHVKIPKGVTSRLGHTGQSYQISQWYPKPAVYDREGWHQMPYLDQGEFYSEFGSFDVSITIPLNYTVGSTGILENKEEQDRLEKLSSDSSWKNNSAGKSVFPPSSKKLKTLRFKENNIHDFAWFADKRFHVLKGNVQLPGSGKLVSTMTLFTDEQSMLWENSIFYINRAVEFLSSVAGDYPYRTFTAVQSAISAGSGMEYPEITVIGNVKDEYSLDETLVHEIAHNWFYGSLGFNERRYPFLDEGITSAYEIRYMNKYYPGKKLWELYFKKPKVARFFNFEKTPAQRENELEWLTSARRNLEQPLNLPAPDFNVVNYDLMVYNKGAGVFTYLRAYLGDSLFDAVMKNFYSENKFTHPGPADLRRSFESGTGRNLSWFFDDLISTTKRLDYKLVKLQNSRLLIKNKAELASPFVIAEMKGDSVVSRQWNEGFKGSKWINIPAGDYSGIELDPDHLMPELYRSNNHLRTKGIFKTVPPVQARFYFTVEDQDKTTLMYFPAVNWTRENGFMVGVALYNGFLLPKRMEYFLLPFYSFNSGFAGYGKLSYNLIPYNNFFRWINFNVEGTRFGAPGNQYYQKLKLGIDAYIRNNESGDPVRQKVFADYTLGSNLQKILNLQKSDYTSYWHIGYFAEKQSKINPFAVLGKLEINKSYLKPTLTFNYRLSYYGVNRGLDMWFFTGKMICSKTGNSLYALSPSGRSGRDEYLFQGTFPDRFAEYPSTFWSRQMDLSEGGLISPVNNYLGFSNWLFSLSFTSSLPGITNYLPVKPFVNFLYNDHGSSTTCKSPLFYEAGIKAGIWNFFEIYLPFLVSENISNYYSTVRDRIRFTFKLDTVFKIRKTGV
jgi:hypothetical protein